MKNWADYLAQRTLTASALGIFAACASAAAPTAVPPGSEAPGSIFAKRLACEAPARSGLLPVMVYDAEMQMMVDPVTRLPIFRPDAVEMYANCLPSITAGCADCPKCDDCCGGG
jgi:hypothetical protein